MIRRPSRYDREHKFDPTEAIANVMAVLLGLSLTVWFCIRFVL